MRSAPATPTWSAPRATWRKSIARKVASPRPTISSGAVTNHDGAPIEITRAGTDRTQSATWLGFILLCSIGGQQIGGQAIKWARATRVALMPAITVVTVADGLVADAIGRTPARTQAP